jgi:hypothetical protein
MTFLREYQLYQDRANRFQLRLRTAGPIPDAFLTELHRVWQPISGDPPAPLEIVPVDHIARSPSGKHLDFYSEFYDDDYARLAANNAAAA